jgi:hypothetical protein
MDAHSNRFNAKTPRIQIQSSRREYDITGFRPRRVLTLANSVISLGLAATPQLFPHRAKKTAGIASRGIRAKKIQPFTARKGGS